MQKAGKLFLRVCGGISANGFAKCQSPTKTEKITVITTNFLFYLTEYFIEQTKTIDTLLSIPHGHTILLLHSVQLFKMKLNFFSEKDGIEYEVF